MVVRPATLIVFGEAPKSKRPSRTVSVVVLEAVAVRPWPPIVRIPRLPPALKVRLLAVVAAGWLMSSVVPSTMLEIVAPTGIPEPTMAMPALRPVVLATLTLLLPELTAPEVRFTGPTDDQERTSGAVVPPLLLSTTPSWVLLPK